MTEPHEVLSKVPLFATSLDAAQLALLAQDSRSAFFRDGTRLMNQGDFGGAMFVIVDGKVTVAFSGEGEEERVVATLGAGEVVGEMSLFTGDRRTASVIADGNVDAIEIGKASLERVFARSPELLDEFARVLARRQAELNKVSGVVHSDEDDFRHRARKAFRRLFRRAS